MDMSRSKRNGFLALAALLTLGTNAFAMGGDAGCGLGSVIIKKNTVMSQTMASTTNGTFASQFFGITSGTSNCNPSGFALVEKEQIFYAESNYRHLIVEMAKGEGENLLAFAQVLGCSDKAAPDFARMTRQKYEVIFPSQKTTPIEMLESVKKEMLGNPVLAKECRSVS